MELEDEIRAIIVEETGKIEGKVGVGFKDFKSGIEVYNYPDDRFLTASVFKIYVLIELYRQVNEGLLNLEDRYNYKFYDRSPGSGILQYLDEGLNLKIRDLAKLMMMISDNTATDILVEILGRDNINETIRKLGLVNTHVAYNCKEMIFGFYSVKEEKRTELEEFLKSIGEAELIEGGLGDVAKKLYYKRRRMGLTLESLKLQNRFSEYFEVSKDTSALSDYEVNDVTSPRDMVRTFSLLYNRSILTPEACDEILGIMAYCQTGYNRLRRHLPRNVIVAHKTGTIPGVVNDAGIIMTSQRDYALAVFVNELNINDRSSIRSGEEVIANISKRIYETLMNVKV